MIFSINDQGFSYSYNRAINHTHLNSQLRTMMQNLQPIYQNIFRMVYRNAPT